MKKIVGFLFVLVMIVALVTNIRAANTAYEVTKSGGALIRTSYSQNASSVRRAAEGTILWVKASKTNVWGNLWYQLTDGNWIYSNNVKKHSCTWTQRSTTKATCYNEGKTIYDCKKCGSTKTTITKKAHTFSGYVCTKCNAYDTSSIKKTNSVNNVKYFVTKNGAAVHNGPYGACKTTHTLKYGTEIVVTQSLVNGSNNTWFKYSGGYIYGNYVKEHNGCKWDNGTVTRNATCTSEGVKTQKCSVCGKKRTISIAKLKHNYKDNVCSVCNAYNPSSIKSTNNVNNVKYYVVSDNAAVHNGPYGACKTTTHLKKGTEIIVTQKLVNASNNTWYKYNGGYIYSNYVKEHNGCKWDNGTVTRNATCTSEGVKTYKCSICSKSKTSAIAKSKHNYKGHVCSVCNAYDPSSIKSTSNVNNVKYYVVSDNAAVHNGPYGACKTTTHLKKGTEIVVTQKIKNGSYNIWYKYSGGYIFGDYVKEHNGCKWDYGTVTKKATCKKEGIKTHKCSICKKTKTSIITKSKHNYKGHVCSVCNAYDPSSIKSTSNVNNVKYYVVSDNAAVHNGPYGACKTTTHLKKGAEIVITQKIKNGNYNTWYKYNDGYIFEDYVKEHNSCKWDYGTVTKKATCTKEGIKTHKCSICKKTKTSTIAKSKHNYVKHVCEKCFDFNPETIKSTTNKNNVKYIVLNNNAPVYNGPYSKCKNIDHLNKGSVITVTQKVVNAHGNSWYKCEYGYIYCDYIQNYESYYAKTTLNKSSLTMYVGETTSLTVTIKGPSSKVTWSSSDTKVAQVDSNGKIKPIKEGKVTISVTANNKTATCSVTIKKLKAPKNVTITPDANGRKFSVKHDSVSDAHGYQISVRESYHSIPSTLKFDKTYTSTSNVIQLDNSDYTEIEVQIRSYRTINNIKVYSSYTQKKTIHVHNSMKVYNTDYQNHNDSIHYTIQTCVCTGCREYFFNKKEEKHNYVCGVCYCCGDLQEDDYVLGKIYPTIKSVKGPSYAENEPKNSEGQVPIYYATKYSDSFFESSSTTMNEGLRKLSAIAAGVSYDKNFAKQFLIECGFSNNILHINSYDVNLTTTNVKADNNNNDYARMTIGHKKIGNKTVVAILVNGYTNGKEWISNFNVNGKNANAKGLHYGFSTAANELTERIYEYIEKCRLSNSNLKFWVTGHSRGGAVTGMVAMNLNKKYSYNNVYAYGFATPNGVPVDMANNSNSKNIFNFVNEADFVPYVVPEEWDFTKYGSNGSETNNKNLIISNMNTKMKQDYQKITGRTYKGLSVSGRKKMIKGFVAYAPDRQSYNIKKGDASPSDFGRAIGLALSESTTEAVKILLKCSFIVSDSSKCPELTPSCVGEGYVIDAEAVNVLIKMLWNGKATNNINATHGMEAYILMNY